jgi:hypothetical protein
MALWNNLRTAEAETSRDLLCDAQNRFPRNSRARSTEYLRRVWGKVADGRSWARKKRMPPLGGSVLILLDAH